MNQAANSRTGPSAATRANSYLFEQENEKAFTKQAFIGITMLILIAWFLTG
jgi:hypothetical protein